MRCRPWRWLWGLLPLALIVFLAVIGERNRVEQDLAVRAEQALQRDGFGWAQPRFEGRDGVLEGTAPKPEDRARAMDTVRRLDGVRVLRDGMDVRVAITPYLWSAQRTDQAIELRG